MFLALGEIANKRRLTSRTLLSDAHSIAWMIGVFVWHVCIISASTGKAIQRDGINLKPQK